MVGVAVKVTLLPVQMDVPGLAAILILAGRSELTDMAMAFEDAGDEVTQEALLIISQLIISLLTRDDEV